MKEKIYILSKLFKKQTIPLFLLTALMVLFFLNVFSRPAVYAKQQLAKMQYEVAVLNGEEKQIVSRNAKTISNLEKSIISFDDIDVKLSAKSKIEFCYIIENITEENCLVNLKLNDEKIENFVFEWYVNDVFVGETIKIRETIKPLSLLKVTIVAYIENPCCDAILNGTIDLKVN